MADQNHETFLLKVIGEPEGRRKWLDHKIRFDQIDLIGVDLSNRDLRDFDFSDVDLSEANLFGADFTGADFSDSILQRANLRRAIMSNCCLDRADLTLANFQGAVLTDSCFEEAVLTSAKLQGADMIGADLSHSNLLRADLRAAIMKYTRLSGAMLTGANVAEADLSGAVMDDEAPKHLRNFDLARIDDRLSRIRKSVGSVTIESAESRRRKGPAATDETIDESIRMPPGTETPMTALFGPPDASPGSASAPEDAPAGQAAAPPPPPPPTVRAAAPAATPPLPRAAAPVVAPPAPPAPPAAPPPPPARESAEPLDPKPAPAPPAASDDWLGASFDSMVGSVSKDKKAQHEAVERAERERGGVFDALAPSTPPAASPKVDDWLNVSFDSMVSDVSKGKKAQEDAVLKAERSRGGGALTPLPSDMKPASVDDWLGASFDSMVGRSGPATPPPAVPPIPAPGLDPEPKKAGVDDWLNASFDDILNKKAPPPVAPATPAAAPKSPPPPAAEPAAAKSSARGASPEEEAPRRPGRDRKRRGEAGAAAGNNPLGVSYVATEADLETDEGCCLILGVKDATSYAMIKRAYRKKAAVFHPDKTRNLSEADQTFAREQFHLVKKAYEALSRRDSASTDMNWVPGVPKRKSVYEYTVDELEKLVKANPRNEELLFNLAFKYHESGNYEGAIVTYERVLGVNEKNIDAAHNLKAVKLQKAFNFT